MINNHPVISHDAWLDARKQFLVKEKAFNRLRDQLSAERRSLPWEQVDKQYVFDGPNGRETLADVFDGRSQLVVYHLMFGPDWESACPSCSFWADNFNGVDIHLAHRDVTLLAISSAPWEKIAAFRQRMGWSFKWVSAAGCDFNRDYHVSFARDQLATGEIEYNYRLTKSSLAELPGISVFYRSPDGTMYHTYSTYARGLDMLNGAYHYLDLAPKGRDEPDVGHKMAWVRHHDRYED